MKILAIDDNPDDVTSLRAVLRELLPAARVLTAPDGPQGLELARAEDPDVILLEIVMPGMDGFAVCRSLKADERLQAIPVLFLTAARGDRQNRVTALEAGGEGFLSKPFDEIELLAQIRVMAKIKAAARLRRMEKEELGALVYRRTRELENVLAERARAEQALRRSEDRYAKAFQTAPYAITITRAADGRFIDVNDTFTAMTGFSREEALADSSIGLKVWVNPEDRQRVVAELRAGRAVAGREYDFRLKDGSVITGSFSAQVIELDGVPSIFSSIEDVTERKLAERQVLATSRRLKMALQAARAGTWEWDVATGSIEWSPEMFGLFGLDPRAAAASFASWRSAVHPEDREIAERRISEALAAHATLDSDYRVVLPGGVVRWINAVGEGVYDDAGRPVRMLGLCQDITGRKEVEAELRRTQATLQAAMDQSPAGIAIADAPDGTLRYVNDAGLLIRGGDRASVVDGVGVDQYAASWRLLDLDGRPLRAEEVPLARAVRYGETCSREFVIRRAEDDDRIVLANAAPIRDESGAVVSAIVVFTDITANHRLAREKAFLEEQLRQSQKIEAIGRLAGGVAHDFNNMTAIVLGYGEMLLGQLPLGDPRRPWAEQIVEAGKRSAGLTRQLLAFSRRQTLNPEVLDLNALLRNFEQMLGRVIGEDIQLTFRLAADPGRVVADPGQLEQVVTNLALNARDAMPLGGRLTIETADVQLDENGGPGLERVVPGEYVVLTLTDTGSGMEAATLARLFEPFFTTKAKGKGTGLGLATAYGIVKQSGGYLWASSEYGQGSSFKIYLPRTEAEVRVRRDDRGGAVRPGAGERILLVEDEAGLRELGETVLARLGYRVSAAATGLEGLALVREQGFEPDLIVTDVIMPDMGGAEMAERIRRDRPGLPVLYLSGYPDDAIARHGVLAPGTPFIQKPFTEAVLAAKVGELLAAGRRAAAPASRRVLMIDDDAQYRELVGRYCTKAGHGFTGVDSSAAALAALAAQPFDALLVDLNIPGTSGEQVLREIRAAGHDTPAIVLTGDVAAADLDVLRPLGAVSALEKSGRPGPLLQAIDEVATAGGAG